MDLGLKNDEQLIKMSTIIQRALSTNKSESDDFGMSAEEKAQLLEEVKNFSPSKD
jgi:hypothetical protein